ncbi:MAG TPA: hypothetical protein VFF06_36125 [Polyangia bacterium]|nr:hypothetical protein [Polyangia bacterium]
MLKRSYWLVLSVLCGSCSGRAQIALNYELGNISPKDVVRVETVIGVDPKDPREFFADQPYRSVATGVGYEVRDVDGSGKREVLITHDATLGYVFTPAWTFTLLPPTDEPAPPLVLIASAHSPDLTIGETGALAAAFGNGAGVKVAIPDKRCGGARCRTNELCCGSDCIDPLVESLDCGGCDMICHVGEQCIGGACECAGGSACTAPATCCPATGCFDLQTNKNNCGMCGNKCGAGETCSGGTCHCGAGAACGVGQHCCSGSCSPVACLCGGVSCADLCCNNVCTPESDANCGACLNACQTPLTCSNGECACHGVHCQMGDQCCSSGCANTNTSNQNCGACGHACGTGESCVGGKCLCGGTTACATGQICCGTACVDPTMDRSNCGSCGHACKTGELCTMTGCSCAGGRACVGNETCCPANAMGGGGGCADLSNDPKNCRFCGNACPNGQSCVGGNCQSSGCTNGCTNGNTCLNGACVCNGGPGCSGAATCCAGIGCVNEQSDTQHCGSCSNKCGLGDYCCGGNCTPPDDNNCTGCFKQCAAGTTCCACPGTTQPPMCILSDLLCGCGVTGGPTH